MKGSIERKTRTTKKKIECKMEKEREKEKERMLKLKTQWFVFICFANAIVVFNFPHLHFSLRHMFGVIVSVPRKKNPIRN